MGKTSRMFLLASFSVLTTSSMTMSYTVLHIWYSVCKSISVVLADLLKLIQGPTQKVVNYGETTVWVIGAYTILYTDTVDRHMSI